MRAMTLVGDGDGEDGKGTGGGDKLPENTDPLEFPMDPVKVQDVPLEKIQDIEKYFPKLPSPDDGLRPEQLPTPSRLNKLNDDVRRTILEGMNGKRGKGAGGGEGNQRRAGQRVGECRRSTSRPIARCAGIDVQAL